jgi:hypothetical protein
MTALLERLDQVIPEGRSIRLLANRVHAGNPFLSCIDALGWNYVIGLAEDTFIEMVIRTNVCYA